MRLSQIRPWALLLAMAWLVAACAVSGFVYRNADWFLKQWAGSYFKLDGQQLAAWEPKLQAELRDHRRNEVPRLIGLMEGFTDETRGGFDEAHSDCLAKGLWDLYSRHAGYGTDLLTPLLELLTPEQVDKLSAQFAKDEEDAPEASAGAVERRLPKRAKRFNSFAEWLVGPLTKEQQALVQKVNGFIPDTGRPWFEHQQKQRQVLLTLLRQKAPPERIHAQLVDWWIDFGAENPTLQKAQTAFVSGMGAMIAGIGQSLAAAQKAHLVKELGDLRKELVGETAKVEVVPLQCAPALARGSRALSVATESQ